VEQGEEREEVKMEEKEKEDRPGLIKDQQRMKNGGKK